MISNTFTIVHETPQRIRLRSSLLAQGLGSATLRHTLETHDGIKRARINTHAASIVVEYDGQKKVRDTFLDILNAPTNWLEPGKKVDYSSSKAIPPWRSGLIMLATPFLPKPVRAALTWANVVPTMLTGAKTLVTQGVKVPVLDGAAVGLSVWRKEWMTANVTQFLLELGEYLQESTERRGLAALGPIVAPSFGVTSL